MRCFAKPPDWRAILIVLLTGLTAPASAAAADAPQVTVLFLQHYVEDDTLKVDLRLRPRLSSAMIDALHHAIPLYFLTQLRLVEHTRLSGMIPMRRTVAEVRFPLRLDYLPEKRQWRLINLDSGWLRQYDLLEDALETLGTYTGIPLAPLARLYPGIRYTIEARFALQRSHLPAPLWLKSLGDTAWQLDSGWYRTDMDPRKLWQR